MAQVADARLAGEFHRHPKTQGVKASRPIDPGAAQMLAPLGLHMLAISYAMDNGTDGLVPKAWVDRFTNGDRAVTGALVKASLWEADDDGWRIHDFDEHNALVAEQEAQRAAARARMARLRRERAAAAETAADDDVRERARTAGDPTTLSSDVRERARTQPSNAAGDRDSPEPPEDRVRANGVSDVVDVVEEGVEDSTATPGSSRKTSEPNVREPAGAVEVLTAVEQTARRLCRELAVNVAARTGAQEIPPLWDSKRWLDAARLLMTVGPPGHKTSGVTADQIEWMLRWLHTGAGAAEFWSGNILSMPTLREKWPKLVLAAQRDHAKKKTGRGGAQTARQQRRAEAIAAAQNGGGS